MLTQIESASQFLGAPAYAIPVNDQPAKASYLNTTSQLYPPQVKPQHLPSINTCANQYMNPFPPIQHSQTQPHHGIKRSAPADEVEQSSNISTHFKKLRLNQTRLPDLATLSPVGVSLRSNVRGPTVGVGHDAWTAPPARHPSIDYYHDEPAATTNTSVPPTPIIPPRADDFMPLDETPHRVYISDLDAEIAAIESQEAQEKSNTNFFLADVDKNISKIPDHVLRGSGGHHAHGDMALANKSANEQALVLYRDPISISVPEEEDAVRKVIIAARREAREKMRREHEDSVSATLSNGYASPYPSRSCNNDHHLNSTLFGKTPDTNERMSNDDFDDDDDEEDDAMDIS